MIVSKFSKVLALLVVLALAGTVVIAGCGGGSSSSASTAEEATPPAQGESGGEAKSEKGAAGGEEEAETGGAGAGGGESSLVAEGKTVFTTNCAACHTLKAAGAMGEVGPNLDELEPDLATVEHQVINGGGGMPAFGKEGTLNAKEIKAVATYVSSVAGRG
jgi:mono/diheme cytochrome c family protein